MEIKQFKDLPLESRIPSNFPVRLSPDLHGCFKARCALLPSVRSATDYLLLLIEESLDKTFPIEKKRFRNIPDKELVKFPVRLSRDLHSRLKAKCALLSKDSPDYRISMNDYVIQVIVNDLNKG